MSKKRQIKPLQFCVYTITPSDLIYSVLCCPADKNASEPEGLRGTSQMPPSTTLLLQWSNPPSPPRRMSLLPHTGEIINSFYCIYLLANNSIKACRRPPPFSRLATRRALFSVAPAKKKFTHLNVVKKKRKKKKYGATKVHHPLKSSCEPSNRPPPSLQERWDPQPADL